ncbi:MAG: RluA family pseudouridine synthase [Planctomycetaceae bacterium]
MLPHMSAPYFAELIVEPFLHGKRIDTFLTKHFRNYSAFRVQRIVRAGEVRINDVLADNDSRVYRDQRVSVRLIEPPDRLLPPAPGPLHILYEDPWLLVVVKPAGQIAHPAGDYATNSLANVVQHHLDQQTRWRGLLRPGIVHRLDRLTSGVMVVAKEHLSHGLLTEAFMRRKVHKTYVALVMGVVEPDSGTLNKPIGESLDRESCLMTTHPDAIDARAAITHFRVLERFPEHTLVEAKPVTGRHHQIRVHFADIGHPVVDDEFYGPYGWIKKDPAGIPTSRPAESRQPIADSRYSIFPVDEDETTAEIPPELLLIGRHALHAHRLEFRHPITWEPLAFEAPLTEDIACVVERLRSPSLCEPMAQATGLGG